MDIADGDESLHQYLFATPNTFSSIESECIAFFILSLFLLLNDNNLIILIVILIELVQIKAKM